MCRLCWALVTILATSSGIMTYKFILSGETSESKDGRIAVHLTTDERDLVLAEMRTFLDSVQQITQGVANDDFTTVATAARKVGRAAQQGMPGTLIGKLPLEFKRLGFDTHTQFSQLALDAEQLADREHTLNQLATLMHNCVACHSTFQFETMQQD